jgi:GT2 family glycosyltransferase
VAETHVTEKQTDLAEKATVVVVPRERLTPAPKTVAVVIASTPSSVPLIVVDGAYPPHVHESIGKLSGERPFTSLRFDHYLLPAEARNRALDMVTTPYAVFVDDDIEVEKGWLENLVTTAERENAAIATPLTTIRRSHPLRQIQAPAHLRE